MAILKDLKFFEQSGLDTDSAIEYIAKNDYIAAWNIRVTGTQPGEAGYISSIESNEPLTPNIAPVAGLSKAIGLSTFETIRTGIAIVYNSAGFHQIINIDYDTNTQSLLYTDKTDSGGIQLLNLDPNFYEQIKLINDIYLLWSDGQSSIGFTNLNTLKSGGYGQVLAEDFSLIKPQCLQPITAIYASDSGKASNFFKQKLFQYTVQYISYEFTYSAWATWSKRIIPVSEATPTVGTDVTVNNAQVVSVNIGSIRVKTLNIACRFGTFDFNIIKQVDTVYITTLPHTTVDISNQIYEAYDPATNIYSFVFYNESLNIPIAPTETDLAYDAVPLAATAIEKINGNIIALGDLTTGYPQPTTAVEVQAVGYNPNVTVPVVTSSQLQIAGTNPGSSGSGQGNHKRLMEVDFSGVAHTGDVMTIIIADIRDAGATNIFSYTVPSGQDGDTLAAVSSFAPIIPNSNFINLGGGLYGIQFVGPSYYGLQNAYVTIAYSGAAVSKSVHAFLDNSSYRAALSYRDTYGRYFPLDTDNTFIFNTPSYAQLLGLTPAMQWKINTPVAPADAVDYQWLVTKNNTTLSVLDVLANLINYLGTWDAHSNTSPTLAPGAGTVGDAYQISVPSIPTDNRNLGNGVEQFNTGDYVVYNGQSWDIVSKNFADMASGNVLVFKINPLNLFNQLYSNAGVNTVLTYGFTNGDTCTLSYYIDSSVINYINNPCVQLSVLGYDPSTFLVKVEKSGTFNSSTIAGKDVLIRLSTPNTQETNVITETAWYEIGERFTITNGLHDVLSGTITDGDVYFKSRQYQGAVDPNTAYSVAVTDFNFSDFYPSAFTSYGRPRAYNDELEHTERKASIITSQNYILGSKNNGLTKFYPASIYGDADGQTSSSFGAIRILWQRNDILIAIQQLHVAYIPVNISILEDQIQQKQYAISEKLLNNVRYSDAGNIGIGDVKESFCFYNNNGFFIDPNRSEPIKLAINGVEPIAGKMSKFFKAQLQLAVSKGYKIVGYYDTFYNEYVVSIQLAGNTLLALPFSVLNWNPFDMYPVTPGDISISVNPTHATASGYNLMTGDILIVPNTNYIGGDTMQISFTTPSGTVTKNACYNWTAGSDAVNPFSFSPKIDQLLSMDIQSNTILVGGNTISTAISITGDPGAMYSVNGAPFTATSGLVNNGDLVKVKVTSSASNSTTTSCTLTIDGQSGTFNVTTEAGGGGGNNFFINNNSSDIVDFVSYSGPETGTFGPVLPSDFLYNAVTAGTYAGSVKVGGVGSPGAYVSINGNPPVYVAGGSTTGYSEATPIFITLTDTP